MTTDPTPASDAAADAWLSGAYVASPEIKGFVQMENEAYHADTTAVSHSALECFRDSPKLYHARYLAKTAPRKETSAFEFGSAFHCLMLEPDRFGREYAVAPERWKQNTNAGKAALKAFEEEHAGAVILWPEEFETLDAISKSAYGDPVIELCLIAPGLVEAAFVVIDHETGVAKKCKPDKVLWIDGKLTILDLKSTPSVSASGFAYNCGKFGYHRQDAFYRDIIAQANDLKPDDVRFLFLACGKEAPNEARLFELDAESVQAGREQNQADLLALSNCKHFDLWPTPGSGEITRVSVPKFFIGD